MKPEWLTIKPASTEKYSKIKETVNSLGLHTVCVEAKCPNITDCWSTGTATFMILGDICTRGCRFCSVSKMSKGAEVDLSEPHKLALAIREWKLGHVVITSVCRDDLPDQGAEHFANCIKEIKKENRNTIVELLIPDFRGDKDCLGTVTAAMPEVIGHNIETVERLSPKLRDGRAKYSQSLAVLKATKELGRRIHTKSAIMLGLGEAEEEVIKSMKDLRDAEVDFLAIGQYLRPTKSQIEVQEYIKPERFAYLREKALQFGFLYVAAGPFVRSSYKAGEFFIKRTVKESTAIC
jgi:lipoic acid synthetase